MAEGFGIKIHFSTFNFYVLDRGYICMYTYITPVSLKSFDNIKKV